MFAELEPEPQPQPLYEVAHLERLRLGTPNPQKAGHVDALRVCTVVVMRAYQRMLDTELALRRRHPVAQRGGLSAAQAGRQERRRGYAVQAVVGAAQEQEGKGRVGRRRAGGGG